ncbi:hypothetical protein E2C01_001749 [Portunus trituberculatus]|uniref:Uncharacterized protein n=1 Tax=Portunus trituberculatus TaxID=210409 RepID=A0A5B7CL67_PORTR|nr:hypothetical protein [Portunus trituberculatus]
MVESNVLLKASQPKQWQDTEMSLLHHTTATSSPQCCQMQCDGFYLHYYSDVHSIFKLHSTDSIMNAAHTMFSKGESLHWCDSCPPQHHWHEES